MTDLANTGHLLPSQVAALGAAIGKVPDYDGLSKMAIERFPKIHAALAKSEANDNLPRVVALTGAAGSGKSTAADYLIRHHGYERVKFAGPLKAAMAAMGFSQQQIEGDLKETPCAWLNFKTPRHAMQTLGTEWGRNCIGEDFWAELWARHANNVLADGRRVVTDDCRFPNEAAAVRSLGGVIVKLEGRGGIAGTHASEAGCGTHDAVVINDGGMVDLYAGVDEAVRRAA